MRCYNGAWDDEANAMFVEQDRLMNKIREIEPLAHLSYFPMEGEFHIHVWGRPLSGFHESRMAAIRDALERLQK